MSAAAKYFEKKTLKKYKDLYYSCGLLSSERVVFEKFVKKTDKILDLGCGVGRTTIPLYELGYKNILGADISAPMIDEANKIAIKNNVDINYEVADALDLRYEDNSFDVVFFSFNGLMCIDSESGRQKATSEAHRVLKKGGLFIFTAYNRELNPKYFGFWKKEEKLWQKGKQNKKLEKFGDTLSKKSADKYVFVPSNKEVKDFVESAGFKLIFNKSKTDICKNTETKIEELMFYVCEKL